MVRKPAGVRADLEVFDLELGGQAFVVMSLPTGTSSSQPDGLSEAERQVAADSSSGLSNAEIAKKRGRSPRTIANQLASIYRKLKVASRAELATRLLQQRR
jgi:DNA-binding NarL/FixJ family response regulator